MRKKKLAKRLLAGLLAVSMALGMEGAVPGDTAYAAVSEGDLVYFVDCGDFNPGTAPDNRKFGSSQSVTDQIYGLDGVTGKSWGVVVSDSDVDIGQPAEAQAGSKAAYTTYQWAKEGQAADSSNEKETFRYAHGQDTAGINPRYVKYQFEADPGTYLITVGMGNSWNNAKNPDIYAGTAGEKETDAKLNAEAMNIPANGYKEAEGTVEVESEGSLYVYALSGEATIQMNCIQIVKMPENVITGLELTAEPVKKEYFVGETLDTSGIEIQATYKNGDTKKVETGRCEITGFDNNKAGQQTVTVSYTEGVTVKTSFTVEVKKMPISVSEDPNLMYFVDCGDFDPETTSEGDSVGISQSVTDRVYGEDKNGKKWGVVVSGADHAISNQNGNGGLGVYTQYQWAHERQTGDLPKEESFRYAKDQAQAGIDPRYVKYQFDVDAGEYQVTAGMGNSWGNAGNPDVYAGTVGEKDADVKLNAESLNIKENGHQEAAGTVQVNKEGSLYVYALSQEATIQMNYIRIIKIPENVITRLEITAEPSKTEYVLGEELDTSGMTVQAEYKDGTKKELSVSDCEITGFDSSKLGTQTITVKYTESLSVETTFQITVKKPPITVSTDPNLVYFVDCGDFDPETTSKGDAVGSNQSVTDRVYGEDKNGKKWGVVTSDADLAIATPPDAQQGSDAVYTTYQWANERQTGDLPKEDSFRYAKDQAQAGIDPRYVKYQFDVDAGEYQVTAGMGNSWGNAGKPDVYAGTAGEKEADVKLNAESLNIKENGHQEAAGTVQVNKEGSLYVYALSEEATIQMNYIQIEKVPQNVITSLRIKQEPEKKEYEVGEELDLAGLSLEAVYRDGTVKAVEVKNCKITGFDSSRPGTKSITVSYREVMTVEAVFTVGVRKPAISVSQDPNLMYFVDCGDFDPETTSGGDAVSSSQSVTDRIYGPDKNGKKWGVVTSDDGDAAIPVPEAAAQKGSSAVYTAYQWAHERQGDDTPKEESFRYAHDQGINGIQTRYVKYRFELDPGRYLVTVGVGNSWGNSGNPNIYAGMTGNPKKDAKLNPDALAIPLGQTREVQGRAAVAEGKNTLEVYVLSEEETIQVNYIKIERAAGAEEGTTLKKLKVVPPQKVIYQFQETQEMDTEGMLVYAVYSDGYENLLPIGEYVVTGFDTGRLGTRTITVKYAEGDIAVQAFFEIIIVNDGTLIVPESLQITPPVKTEYLLGEELDLAGIVLTLCYSDGTKRTALPEECCILGFNGNKEGRQTVMVVYTDENGASVSAEFTVEVYKQGTQPKAVLSGLEVVRLPDKTEYKLNEAWELDIKGMEVAACYSDGAKKEVNLAECRITGFDSSKEGEQVITVVYEENGRTAEASFKVKIVKETETPRTYKVIYHDNKGGRVSGMPSDKKSYQKGQKAAVKGTPVSTSKFFAGWNTRADGKGKSYAAGKKITVQGDIHLYARWKKSYTAPNKLKYKVTGRKTVACTKTANKKAVSIKVPAAVKYQGITYKVTSIGAKAFAKNKKIKKVTIGNNVKSIKERAFEKCGNLKSITVGTGLTSIEKYAFSGEKKGCVLNINSKKLKTVKSAINHKTKNMVIKVPKSKLKAYKKLFAKKAKKVKVIAK